MMLASGTSLVITRLTGNTTSELSAIPKGHIMLAPMQTCIGIRNTSSSRALHSIQQLDLARFSLARLRDKEGAEGPPVRAKENSPQRQHCGRGREASTKRPHSSDDPSHSCPGSGENVTPDRK